MSKVKKLQYEAYNKAVALENKLMEQLKEYDEKIVNTMANELDNLEAEYEALKLNGNVRTDFNMDEYLVNQRRIKELPTLISDLQRDRIKAIEDRKILKDELCRGIYKEVGEDYRAEFNSNMEILINEYDKALTQLIELNKQMETLEYDYKWGLDNVISTKGIYLTLNKDIFINQILEKHNLNKKSLDLYNAK